MALFSMKDIGQERDLPEEAAELTSPPELHDRNIEIALLLRQDELLGELTLRLEQMALQRPEQRRYLTHEELKALAARHTNREAVERFASTNRLRIKDPGHYLNTVRLVGRAHDVERALGIKFKYFKLPGIRWRTYTGQPVLPEFVRGGIEGVLGLDAVFQSRRKSGPEAREERTTRGARGLPVPGNGMYTAPEVARLYELPEALDGTGQCVGLVLPAGDFSEDDLTSYFDMLGLNPKPRIIRVHGNKPGMLLVADFEATLDVEIAAGICPGAQVVAYGSDNDGEDGNQLLWLVTALENAICDEVHKPSVLSVSVVFPEIGPIYKLLGRGGGMSQEHLALERWLLIAAILGITVCAASGDTGSVAPMGAGGEDMFVFSAVNHPAASPYVLACGGTTLFSRGAKISSETVWGDLDQAIVVKFPSTMSLGGPPGSGGGVSRHYALPAYQAGADVPPVVTTVVDNGQLGEPQRFQGRGVPDVAANAAPHTGWRLFYAQKEAVGYGTSASAPFWAGLIARINQGLTETHGVPVRCGWVNPLLYALQLEQGKGVFRTITQGSNGGFSAAYGRMWNACTGLGSPEGTRLAEALGVSLSRVTSHRGQAR